MSDEIEQPVDEAQRALDKGLSQLDRSRMRPLGENRTHLEHSAVASLTASMAVSMYELRTAALESLEVLKRFTEPREYPMPLHQDHRDDPEGAWACDGETAWDEHGVVMSVWDDEKKTWVAQSDEPNSAHRSDG